MVGNPEDRFSPVNDHTIWGCLVTGIFVCVLFCTKNGQGEQWGLGIWIGVVEFEDRKIRRKGILFGENECYYKYKISRLTRCLLGNFPCFFVVC